MEFVVLHGVFMKLSFVILFFVVFSSGCAPQYGAIKTVNLSDVYDGRWDGVYARLSSFGFSDFCLSRPVYKQIDGFSCDIDKLYDKSLSYFSLGSAMPMTSTKWRAEDLNDAVMGDNYTKVEAEIDRLKAEYVDQLEQRRKYRAEQARKKAEEKEAQRIEALRLKNERLSAQKSFNELSLSRKDIGDKVCRGDNLYGFVEGVSGDKVQVRLVGKALDVDEYFFFGKGGSFYSRDIKEIGWFESKDFAECSFDINY